jgi:restriction endonuclease S subunit
MPPQSCHCGLYQFLHPNPTGKDVFTRRLLVPLPPLGEQAAIARILDAVDAALQDVAAAVQKATVLRRSMIHELLSRGTKREKSRQSAAGIIPRSWMCEALGKHIAVCCPWEI